MDNSKCYLIYSVYEGEIGNVFEVHTCESSAKEKVAELMKQRRRLHEADFGQQSNVGYIQHMKQLVNVPYYSYVELPLLCDEYPR